MELYMGDSVILYLKNMNVVIPAKLATWVLALSSGYCYGYR